MQLALGCRRFQRRTFCYPIGVQIPAVKGIAFDRVGGYVFQGFAVNDADRLDGDGCLILNAVFFDNIFDLRCHRRILRGKRRGRVQGVVVLVQIGLSRFFGQFYFHFKRVRVIALEPADKRIPLSRLIRGGYGFQILRRESGDLLGGGRQRFCLPAVFGLVGNRDLFLFPLRDILRVFRHRLINLRLPARKRPARFAIRNRSRVFLVICRRRVVVMPDICMIFCFKSTVIARFIRYRVANFLVIDLNNVLAFIRSNRQRELCRLSLIKLITDFRLGRVRVDLRSAHLSFADYGCIFVFYVVVVIFNRIPIRAAIIDIERVINLLQFERSIRISDNFVTAIKLFWR